MLPDGTRFLTDDGAGWVNIWNLDVETESRPRSFRKAYEVNNMWSFDKRGDWFAIADASNKLAAVWSLTGPVSAGPQVLRRGGRNTPFVVVHPNGDWVAVSDADEGGGAVSLWPLRSSYPSILFRPEQNFLGMAVDPKGKFVAAATWPGNKLSLVSLEATGDARPKVLRDGGPIPTGVAISPDGEQVAVGDWRGNVSIFSVVDETSQQVGGFSSYMHQIVFDSSGTRLAAAAGLSQVEDAAIRAWNLKTGEVQVLGAGQVALRLQFGTDGRLYSSGLEGLRAWNLSTGLSELLIPGVVGRLSPDGRSFLGGEVTESREVAEAVIYDLETGEARSLASHGKILHMEWHPSGEAVLTTTTDGLIQIGPVTGEAPHRLSGHTGRNVFVQVHPNGDWILSAGEEGTLRLWHMPDLSRPAFHTLPYDRLIARLKSLTNYRVVEDEGSPGGYAIEYDKFIDWAKGIPELD
jgi:WD40 repeat protein